MLIYVSLFHSRDFEINSWPRDRIQALSLISTVGKISSYSNGFNNLSNFLQGRRKVLFYGGLNA